MRKYDPTTDEPRTGWDHWAVEDAIERGVNLTVDDNFEIWSEDRKEYVGKIRKECLK